MHILVIARLKVFVAVFTVTTRVLPTIPRCVSTTRPNNHFNGGRLSSYNKTKFYTFTLSCGANYLFISGKVHKYSQDHRDQKFCKFFIIF